MDIRRARLAVSQRAGTAGRRGFFEGGSLVFAVPLERKTEMTKPPTKPAAPKAPVHMIETINKIVRLEGEGQPS